MPAPLSAALELARLGWRLLPVHPKTGESLLPDPEMQASASPKQIEAWFAQWPDLAIGLLLGPRSGIACIETSEARAETVVEWYIRGDASSPPPTFRQGKTICRLVCHDPEVLGMAVMTVDGCRLRPRGHVVLPPSLAPGETFSEWIDQPSGMRIPDCGFRPIGLDDDGIRIISDLIYSRRELDPSFRPLPLTSGRWPQPEVSAEEPRVPKTAHSQGPAESSRDHSWSADDLTDDQFDILCRAADTAGPASIEDLSAVLDEDNCLPRATAAASHLAEIGFLSEKRGRFQITAAGRAALA